VISKHILWRSNQDIWSWHQCRCSAGTTFPSWIPWSLGLVTIGMVSSSKRTCLFELLSEMWYQSSPRIDLLWRYFCLLFILWIVPDVGLFMEINGTPIMPLLRSYLKSLYLAWWSQLLLFIKPPLSILAEYPSYSSQNPPQEISLIKAIIQTAMHCELLTASCRAWIPYTTSLPPADEFALQTNHSLITNRLLIHERTTNKSFSKSRNNKTRMPCSRQRSYKIHRTLAWLQSDP